MRKNLNISFNHQMQLFRFKYEQLYLPKDMKPYWMAYQKKRFKESYYPAFKRASNKKGCFKIFNELLVLLFKWKCMPYHYFRYALYNKNIDKKTLFSYLPETVFYHKILPKINSQYFLLDNKIVAYDILKANNILIPKTLLKVISGKVFDSCGNIIDENTFLHFLKSCPSQMVAKYANCGSGGKQIKMFSRQADSFYCDEESITFDKLVNNYDGWIFQEKLFNTSQIANVHKSSLNSFRVVTYLKNNIPYVLYAILKFGNNNAETDNAHTNGVYVKVNINTGITEGLAYNENLESFEYHPFTNVKMDGLKIDNFNSVVELAKKCALLFPTLSFVGWDIALTDNGPVVIEGNSSPGLTIIERTHNGMGEFLKLYENNI